MISSNTERLRRNLIVVRGTHEHAGHSGLQVYFRKSKCLSVYASTKYKSINKTVEWMRNPFKRLLEGFLFGSEGKQTPWQSFFLGLCVQFIFILQKKTIVWKHFQTTPSWGSKKLQTFADIYFNASLESTWIAANHQIK